jgi:hypothetical protein
VVPHIAPPEAFEGKALWVSHGSADNVIPPSAAQATRELARTLPLALSGSDFPGAARDPPGRAAGHAGVAAVAQRASRRAMTIACISPTQSSQTGTLGLHQQPVAPAAPGGSQQCMDGGGRGQRCRSLQAAKACSQRAASSVVHPAVVLGLGHAVFEHQHLVVEGGQAFELRVAGQAHQPLHPLAPCELGGRDDLGVDPREQRFDAMAHVAREQGFLVGKVS